MTVIVWFNNYGEWMHAYREKYNNDLVIIHDMETFSAFHCSKASSLGELDSKTQWLEKQMESPLSGNSEHYSLII